MTKTETVCNFCGITSSETRDMMQAHNAAICGGCATSFAKETSSVMRPWEFFQVVAAIIGKLDDDAEARDGEIHKLMVGLLKELGYKRGLELIRLAREARD